MTAANARITVSICTYDRYDVLPKAIESVAGQSLSRDRYRILVVDNSPDRRKAEAFGHRFETLPNLSYVTEATPGLSNARNLSARICDTPFVAFMDDDAIAAPDWLAEVLTAFEQFGASAMVVGGRVDPLWETPRPPWLHDALLGNVSVVDWGGETRAAAAHEWLAGTNISFRTE
ncbi:MAG TPA: glycosyltransferase family 2 protein, partial [Stellaceae bacterium]|nr:glycosyltransferase family 2 protein [Stellaceae bacterium]